MSRRQPLPYHAREYIELSRDAALSIMAEAQAIANVGKTAAQSKDQDGWRALAHATARVGTIMHLATFIVRELERIEGVDRPPDTPMRRLIERPETDSHE